MNQNDRPPEEAASAGKCGACGAELPANTRFCPTCGAPATDVCPSCREKVQPGERFCRYCGTQVAAFMSGRAQQAQSTPVSPEMSEQEDGRTEPVGGNNVPVENDLRNAGYSSPSYRPQIPAGITCPRCGAQGDVNDSFCNSCGLPFDEQPDRPAVGEGLGFRYGSVIERFVARLIDGFVLLAVLIAIFVIGGDRLVSAEGTEAATWFQIVWFLVVLAYHTLFISIWGTTPGKRVMGLRVAAPSGRRPGFGQALVRELATIISTLTLLIGYLMALFREDRRTLHDLIAGTIVVSDKP